MKQDKDQLIQCKKCNSKIYNKVWQIHKLMCNPQKKSFTNSQNNKLSQSPKPITILIRPTTSLIKGKQQMQISKNSKYQEISKQKQKETEREREKQKQGGFEQQNMIPCTQCGESVPFQFYAIHEQECIGHQLVQCQGCNIKFPTFLIQQHYQVCQHQKRPELPQQQQQQQPEQPYLDLQSQYPQPQPQQPNQQLLTLIQNLAVSQLHPPSIPEQKAQIQGLSQLQINQLKRISVLDGQQCSICCTSMRRFQKNIQLNCRHVYHAKCIEPWLRKNCRCPMCRRPVGGK